MRAGDREVLRAEGRGRIESMLQRFSEVRVVVPWLRPGMSHSQLRRTAARLRAGVIHPADPHIRPSMLADVIEQAIVQDLMVRSVVREMFELSRMERRMARRTSVVA